jgi:hypothetical protein
LLIVDSKVGFEFVVASFSLRSSLIVYRSSWIPSYPLAAVGTELKLRRYLSAAAGTASFAPLPESAQSGSAPLVKNLAAAVTLDVGFSPFNGKQRDKEKAQVMVEAFEPGGGKPTTRTGPRLVIDLPLFGLHPADKNEGTSPPALDVSNLTPIVNLKISKQQ